MLQTRSNGLLVTMTNTQAGGSAVVITNSGGMYAMQSGYWVVSSTILNSAGWVVNVANTGGSVNIANSAGWIVSVANTSGIKTFTTLETAQMSSNGIALTAGYAVINASGTDNTIVSAVTTKKIRVLAFNLMSSFGNNAIFQSGTGVSNLLTGTYFIGSNGGLVAGYNPVGWFESSGNNLLNLKLSQAQSVGGSLTYLEI